MKLHLYGLILCCSLTQVWAQYDFKQDYFINQEPIIKTDSLLVEADSTKDSIRIKKNYLEISAGYLVNSNSITNEFVTDFYFGGAISRESRQNAANRLGNRNTLGLFLYSNLIYKRALPSFNLTFGLNQSLVSNNRFSEDITNLYFFGNSPFAGESLDLAPSSVSIYNYQSFEIGIEKKLNDKLFISGALNLFQSTYFYDLELQRGDFFTESDGTEIILDAVFEQTFSDNESDPGTGLGIDVALAYQLSEKAKISFKIEDLGYINYKNLVQNKVDSLYNFSGAEIDDIFQLDQINTGNLNTENFNETFGISEERVDKTVISPASFTLGYQGSLKPEVLSISTYLNYRIINSYLPLLLIKPTYHITDYLSIAPAINLGGFGRFDLGLDIEISKGPFFLSTSIYEFEHLVAKSNTSGRGTSIKAGLLF